MICTDHYSQCHFSNVILFLHFSTAGAEISKETKRISQKWKEEMNQAPMQINCRINNAWCRLSLESPVVRKAFPAVNWSARVGLERYFGLNFTVRTNCGVHFSGSAKITPSETSFIKNHFCFTLVLVLLNSLKIRLYRTL